MWIDLLSSYSLRIVLAGTILLGITSGTVGVFLNLRKQSLVGDALSHSALPGVVLAYMITLEASLYVSIVGAIVAAVFSMFLMDMIRKYSKVKNDAILALILSSFFGFGQVLLSIIRDTAGQNQARLKSFIFGQAATMSSQDVTFLGIILVIVMVTVVLFWRHIKLFIFNEDFYQSIGFSKYMINLILNALVILVVVSGIQTVGVILMSALLIAPGVAARLWSDRLGINVLLASLFGGISGLLGTMIGVNMATGPVIVICVTLIVLISLFIAPRKGFIWKNLAESIHKKEIKKYHLLIHLFTMGSLSETPNGSLDDLIGDGFLMIEKGKYNLTEKGNKKVFKLMAGDTR